MAGRFAPSPTARLHLGNLRTALVAWLLARGTGGEFRLRIEDLDAARVAAAGSIARQQIADLLAIGLNFDADVVWQSHRLELYRAAVANLDTYQCFCTRREIAEAATAPHGDSHRPYPGTCLRLSQARRNELAATRPPAIRVRADSATFTITDLWAGEVTGVVDDFVLVRNDGVPAYNLAVVVDDLAMGIDQVVRGDDLLSSAPRQAWLADLLIRLGYSGAVPGYAHVPLAVNSAGQRLSKRDGAVSLPDLAAVGVGPEQVLKLIAKSLDLGHSGEPVTPEDLLRQFEPSRMPRQPWIFDPGLAQPSE